MLSVYFVMWPLYCLLVSQRLPWIRANMKPSLVNFTLWDCFCERQIYFKVKKLINDLLKIGKSAVLLDVSPNLLCWGP